jgi:flavin-binding protein dodecin
MSVRAVLSTNRLLENIGRAHQTVQRIDVMEIMNDIHIVAGATPPVRSGGC